MEPGLSASFVSRIQNPENFNFDMTNSVGTSPHSSKDSSVTSILKPCVQIPSTPLCCDLIDTLFITELSKITKIEKEVAHRD